MRQSLLQRFSFLIPGLLFAVALLSPHLAQRAPSWKAWFSLLAALHHPGDLGIITGVMIVYGCVFYWLPWLSSLRRGGTFPWLPAWSTGLILIGALRYYPISLDQPVSSTFPILAAGWAAGGTILFILKKMGEAPSNGNPTPMAKHLVPLWILLIAVLACWQPEGPKSYAYRDLVRWIGPWQNPNTFGLLTALGTLLAAGWSWRVWARAGWSVTLLPPVLSLGWLGYACLRSLSRGAWLGLTFAIASLLLPRCIPWARTVLRRYRPANILLSTLCAMSLGVLILWSFRHVENPWVQRFYSVFNTNDLSWRNRVDAYTGSLAMLHDRPWKGWGWDQPLIWYAALYKQEVLAEAGAIQLNDHLRVGTTLGFPALMAWLGFLCWGLLQPSREPYSSPLEAPSWQGICRAGTLLLALGFWFDNGLFQLVLGIPFWMLAALGYSGWFPERDLGVQRQEPSKRLGMPFRAWLATAGSLVIAVTWAHSVSGMERETLQDEHQHQALVIRPKNATNRLPVLLLSLAPGMRLEDLAADLTHIAHMGFATVAIPASSPMPGIPVPDWTFWARKVRQSPWAHAGQLVLVDMSPPAKSSPDTTALDPWEKEHWEIEDWKPALRIFVSDTETLASTQESKPITALEKVPTVIIDLSSSTSDSSASQIEWWMQTTESRQKWFWKLRERDLAQTRPMLLQGIAEYSRQFISIPGQQLDATDPSGPPMVSHPWEGYALGILLGLVSILPGMSFRAKLLPQWRHIAPQGSRLLFSSTLALISIAVVILMIHVWLPWVRSRSVPDSLACITLPPGRQREDLEFLMHSTPDGPVLLRDLRDHVILSHYRGPFLYASLPEEIWHQHVVSPWIRSGLNPGWRRPLWRFFYPRVRKADSPGEAAQILVNVLRERVIPNPAAPVSPDLNTSWSLRSAPPNQWEEIYVAALRAVTVAARLRPDGLAEIYDGTQWIPAPRPSMGILDPALVLRPLASTEKTWSQQSQPSPQKGVSNPRRG